MKNQEKIAGDKDGINRQFDCKHPQTFGSLFFHAGFNRKNYGVFKSPAESSDNGLAALSFQRFNAGTVHDGCAQPPQQPN
jgi:hypothetical protein